MKDIYKVHKLVEDMLVANPDTRNSDQYLYLKICEQIEPRIAMMPYAQVIFERKRMGLPNLDTVTRARRRIQEHNPLLRATKKVDDARFENFKVVLNYVKDEI